MRESGLNRESQRNEEKMIVLGRRLISDRVSALVQGRKGENLCEGIFVGNRKLETYRAYYNQEN